MADDLIMPKAAWYQRKLLWIVVLVVVAVGGGAAWWLLKPSGTPEAEQVVDTQVFYVGLSRPVVFSVQAGNRDRLVQVEVQLMVRGSENESRTRHHLPLLESTLLTVFSRQSADNYLTAESKNMVRQEALNELNAVLTDELGVPPIEKVLFTGIVMQ